MPAMMTIEHEDCMWEENTWEEEPVFPKYSLIPSPTLVSCLDYFSPSGKILFGELPISFWFQYFEITVTSHQLDCVFKNALENSKL